MDKTTRGPRVSKSLCLQVPGAQAALTGGGGGSPTLLRKILSPVRGAISWRLPCAGQGSSHRPRERSVREAAVLKEGCDGGSDFALEISRHLAAWLL